MSRTTTARESPGLAPFLRPGIYVDSDHPAVVAFAREHAGPDDGPCARAVRLYYAVRDGFLYDPYRLDTSVEGLKASSVLARGRGFCVTKAALLAAAGRALGIPARVGYADVRNHLTSARLRQAMGTDLFVFHGYVELRLDGRWVKATPAFNRSLCDKAGIHPLEFDGRADSVFHAFDARGRRHMEYVRERGSYADVPRAARRADVPRAALLAAWRAAYPGFADGALASDGDFEAEVKRGGA